MEKDPIEPLGTGLWNRLKGWLRSTLRWVGRVLKSRLTLLIALRVAKVIVYLVRIFINFFDGS